MRSMHVADLGDGEGTCAAAEARDTASVPGIARSVAFPCAVSIPHCT